MVNNFFNSYVSLTLQGLNFERFLFYVKQNKISLKNIAQIIKLFVLR